MVMAAVVSPLGVRKIQKGEGKKREWWLVRDRYGLVRGGGEEERERGEENVTSVRSPVTNSPRTVS